MAIFSSKITSNYHTRSVSLPSRAHPTTQTVDDELKKLKSWEEEASTSSSSISAGSICYGLTGLQELYQCIDDLLNLSSTIDALSSQKNKKFVDELLDISVRILDICGNAKDIVSQCKENARDIQSSLRRRKGSNSNIETIVTKYFSSRRQTKKDAKKRALVNLKQLDQEINASVSIMEGLDDHVSSVIRVLLEVNSRTISIFQAVLKFLSVKSDKQKIKKWTLVSRLVQKEKVGTESSNELENADAALRCQCENDQIEMGRVHIVQDRLQVLGGSLEGLENQLDTMFRCMIRSRTTILNVLSC